MHTFNPPRICWLRYDLITRAYDVIGLVAITKAYFERTKYSEVARLRVSCSRGPLSTTGEIPDALMIPDSGALCGTNSKRARALDDTVVPEFDLVVNRKCFGIG